MFAFNTKTEEAFSNLMSAKKIVCSKIEEDKINKVPDFLCELNNYKTVFEIKDLMPSGTEKWANGVLIQRINIEKVVCGFVKDASEKFLNKNYSNFDSGLVINNFRTNIRFEELIVEVEKVIKNCLGEYSEVGNLIITGYSAPTNEIRAFHIFENKKSKRIINKLFFKDINTKYHEIK